MHLELQTMLVLLLADAGCVSMGFTRCRSDLQVKVIPSAEDHMVSLVCSCDPSEGPAVYVWYRNGETVYEDRSAWYRELVGGEKAVTYSCAVRGLEHLRAPEVSVDSVTSACFTVTYATGKMCPDQANGSCSITYPKEVHVQAEPSTHNNVKLTCNTSCSLMDPQTAFIWYENGLSTEKIRTVPLTTIHIFSCAVKSHEFLLADEFCVDVTHCGSVRYASRMICALKGSSVTISSRYLRPDEQQNEHWLRSDRRSLENSPRIKNHHDLTINELEKNDSAKYIFMASDRQMNWVNAPGVTLFVTDLHVEFAPSAVVTEGQTVTVTCRTSCPLADDTNYIWYFNNQTLNVTKRPNKRLVLDPVSSRHAGNYACAVVETRSSEDVLTVHRNNNGWYPKTWILAVTRVVAVLLVLIIPAVVFMWRKSTTPRESPGAETSDNVEQISLGRDV